MNKHVPDKKGYFGSFGGRFIPETLVPALKELTQAFEAARRDKEFQKQLNSYLADYAGRPTPLYHASQLEHKLSGPKIYLKREDILHTGAHKINNTLGQVLLAKRIGKKRIIAETGAGQHGVATATACAVMGLPCVVYMGEEDIRRQALNVWKMELLGAEVIPVKTGSKTLKDAVNEAIRDWVASVRTTHYVLGSVVGPHPYPVMVREFQSVIGKETRRQILKKEGRLPDYMFACVGGGSNSTGFMYPFMNDSSVKFVGVEAGGSGLSTGKHAATLIAGRPGILHGARSYLMQDKYGQVLTTHSVAAGLDYPGVGPELSYWKDTGRASFVSVTDSEALRAFHVLAETEGIIPALEPSHAIAELIKRAPKLKGKLVALCLSGRGDKDVDVVREAMAEKWRRKRN